MERRASGTASSAACADGIAIEHRSIVYDHVAAAGKMRRAGLPEGYALALSTGFWPSCDVLPVEEIRARGRALVPGTVVWKHPTNPASRLWPRRGVRRSRRSGRNRCSAPALDQRKFRLPEVTAKGEQRAAVDFASLKTLWFNTGTLCNIACRNCYIDSGPRKDQLAYLTPRDVSQFLDEIEQGNFGTREIGFTGGEPFMNPGFFDILDDTLSRGHDVLVLTNAMRPMQRSKAKLAAGQVALRRPAAAESFARSFYAGAPRGRARRRNVRSNPARSAVARAIRLQRLGGRADHVGRTAGGATRRLCPPVCRARYSYRRERSRTACAVPGNGTARRRSGNHRTMLGHSGLIAAGHHVFAVADGGEAEGRGSACRSGLHADRL